MKTMTPSIMEIFGKYENFNENFSNMKRRPLRKTTQIQKTLVFFAKQKLWYENKKSEILKQLSFSLVSSSVVLRIAL